MGQKIHPKGLRLGIIRTWDSRWYAEKKLYVSLLHEDIAIRSFIRKRLKNAAISTIEIERTANRIKVIVHTAKPGIVIGRSGAGVDRLKDEIESLVNKFIQKQKAEHPQRGASKGKENIEKQVQISVQEVFQPELDGYLVAENIALQMERRISFRRAMKQAVMRSMRAGAKGIKVSVGGRLGGTEIARHEGYKEGKIPLHTLRADIDYGFAESFTPYGQIGVKVWIYKGDIIEERRRKISVPSTRAAEAQIPSTEILAEGVPAEEGVAPAQDSAAAETSTENTSASHVQADTSPEIKEKP